MDRQAGFYKDYYSILKKYCKENEIDVYGHRWQIKWILTTLKILSKFKDPCNIYFLYTEDSILAIAYCDIKDHNNYLAFYPEENLMEYTHMGSSPDKTFALYTEDINEDSIKLMLDRFVNNGK